MAKKLKSLNPIIGTGYKTLSMIKDGEDGNIENFPDTLPKIPRLSYKRLGVSGLEIGWEFEDKIYYTYELYGSTTKGFKASEENLMFQGLASSYFYEAKPGEKWYFKARAKNTHGRYTEFSSELVTYTVKLDNLGDYVEGESINGALIENATINNAHIKDLHADKITAGVLDADRIGANSITANHIQANTIQSGHIQAGAITAGSGIIADGAIGSAQISKLDAGKIESGTIDTSKITVQGANGHLRLKGNRMQVFDGIGNQAKERVSIGDVNGDGTVYGLRVRGKDGATVLLDENGVTSEGITDGSITNDKINEDANIDGAKLNINSVVNKINEDGTEVIKGTKIEVDGTNLGVKLSEITNKQSEDGEKITQAQAQITANQNAINLKVDRQVYTTDKANLTSKLEKNTSDISLMKDQIALKVEQTDIENIKNELETSLESKISETKSEIQITTDAISQKVGKLESDTTMLDGKVTSHESRLAVAEQKITDKAITSVVQGSQFVKDMNGQITTNKNNISKVEQTANSITSTVSDLNGKYTQLKQTVDGIDMTGKVSFSDLSTSGRTVINGANITTGYINGNRIKGGIISATDEINFVGGARIFGNEGAYGAGLKISAQEYQFKSGDAYFESNLYAQKGLKVTGTATANRIEVAGDIVGNNNIYAKGQYLVYHTGNKPTPSAIGALSTSGGTVSGNLTVNGTLYGTNSIALSRGSVYIANFGANYTMNYLRGNSNNIISFTDSGGIHFLYSSYSGASMARGSVYLPHNGNTTCDHFRLGYGVMASPSSGSFHFLTANGSASPLYSGTVYTKSILTANETETITEKSAFDEINNINVISTKDGLRLFNPVETTDELDSSPCVVKTQYNKEKEQIETDMDYTSAIATLWKAVQELKQENDELKEIIKDIHSKL